MASRDINDLYKPLKLVLEEALKIAKKRGLPVVIISTLRTPEEQEALYAQGRKPLMVVNALRKKAKLLPITETENKKKITWTKKSYHNTLPKSMAFDFAIGTRKKIYWDVKADVNADDIPDYKQFASILCKEVCPNLEWGGDWSKKNKDYGHIQWKNGLNIIQKKEIEPPCIDSTASPELEVDEVVEEKPNQKNKPFLAFLKKLFSLVIRFNRRST